MTNSTSEANPLAFVIMPFNEEFNHIYGELISPALESAGYIVRRADKVLTDQNILRSVVSGLRDARLVIAEVTELNANVYYELGLAHGMRKTAILLTQSVDAIPFDLKMYRHVVYGTSYREVDAFKAELCQVAKLALSDDFNAGNPVTDFGAGAEAVREPARDSDGPESEGVEPGHLDLLADTEESMLRIGAIAQSVTELYQELNAATESHTSELREESKSDALGRAGRMRKIATALAGGLDAFAGKLRPLVADLHDQWISYRENSLRLFQRFDPKAAEVRDTMLSMRTKTSGFADTLTNVIGSTRQMRNAVGDNTRGMSRELEIAGRRAVSELDKLIEELTVGLSATNRIVNVIDERLGVGGGPAIDSQHE